MSCCHGEYKHVGARLSGVVCSSGVVVFCRWRRHGDPFAASKHWNGRYGRLWGTKTEVSENMTGYEKATWKENINSKKFQKTEHKIKIQWRMASKYPVCNRIAAYELAILTSSRLTVKLPTLFRSLVEYSVRIAVTFSIRVCLGARSLSVNSLIALALYLSLMCFSYIFLISLSLPYIHFLAFWRQPIVLLPSSMFSTFALILP